MLAGVRRHLHQSKLYDDIVKPFGLISAKRDLVGMQISIPGSAILIFGCYHRGGLDPEVQAGISQATQGGQLPFIVMGDFNEEPSKLLQDSWLEKMGAKHHGAERRRPHLQAEREGHRQDH